MFYDPPVSAVKWTSLQFLATPLHPPAPGGGSGGVGEGGMQDLLGALNLPQPQGQHGARERDEARVVYASGHRHVSKQGHAPSSAF